MKKEKCRGVALARPTEKKDIKQNVGADVCSHSENKHCKDTGHRAQRGITLIALVITIIILLILTGVTISLLTGESGILTKAEKAVETTKRAQIDEQIKLAKAAAKIEKEGRDITVEDILKELTVQGVKYQQGEEKNEIIIDGKYKIEIHPEEDTVKKDGSWTGKVNSPKLMSGMKAVYWDDSNQEKELNANSTSIEWSNWYQYKAGDNVTDTKTSKWANAKITKEGADSYFVWIPRYEYKIVSGEGTSTAGPIEVKFIPTSQTTADEGYKIHPAFQDGTSNHFKRGEWDKELSGIWVAKYETSHSDATESSAGSSSTLKIVPNVQSWRNISVGDCYTTAYNYDRNKESHMMKNSEWGAVAYLTHSQYGRNGHEIDINNSSSYITGNGGGSTNASSAEGITNAYHTAKGMQASTTGNIYGIYDLNGGAWERVAGYISSGEQRLDNGSSFAYQTADLEGYQTKSTKYATVYPFAYSGAGDRYSNNYNAYKNAKYGYGDAILETTASGCDATSWFEGYSYYLLHEYPFFVRGGRFSSECCSLFCFDGNEGDIQLDRSFRVVLARYLVIFAE